MIDPAEFLIEPELYLRDGHVIRSIGDAIAYLREHEVRPASTLEMRCFINWKGQAPIGRGKQQPRHFSPGQKN
jgi:hypothetical protein